MDKAHLILYGVASFLALKALVSLMTAHRRELLKTIETTSNVEPAPAEAAQSEPRKAG